MSNAICFNARFCTPMTFMIFMVPNRNCSNRALRDAVGRYRGVGAVMCVKIVLMVLLYFKSRDG